MSLPIINKQISPEASIAEHKKLCELGRAVIQTEADAVQALIERIDENFANACDLLLACRGRIVVIGMGKSGHIGNKIAATLASTGSPAFFVHPGEASHGDLGMITHNDVVIALSSSGETPEILLILPLLKRLEVPLIILTGKINSSLAKEATVTLDVSVAKEACPLGLAPTSSTTAALAMGDALAIALLEARGFTADDFALSHPGGMLGRRLLLRVNEIMRTGDAIPKVYQNTTVMDALLEITEKRLGMTTVIDDQNKVLGIYTDGDLRRTLDKKFDVHTTSLSQVMTHNPKNTYPETLAAEALQIMERHKITVLLVMDHEQNLVGILHMHDLLQAGLA